MAWRSVAKFALRLAAAAAVLLIWHLCNVFAWVPPFLLPSIGSVARAFAKIIAHGDFWPDLRVTMYEYVVSFGLAAPAALLIGFLVSQSNYAVRVFDPLFAGMFSVPLVILFPMFALLFGVGPGSKIAIGTTTAFFPIVLSTIAGFTTVERFYLLGARSMGASQSQMFLQVMLPAAFPVILTGLRIGLIISFLAIIGTETLAAYSGLGRRIADMAEQMDSPGMYGYIVFVILVAIVINIIANGLEALGRRRFQ